MVPNDFDTKMLRILPTKEIKVFHSASQVGIAYILVALASEKIRIFFHQVTLVAKEPVTSKFQTN
jgi:hypothetical protein